jgi:phosphoribosylpyrophosphate synthetase
MIQTDYLHSAFCPTEFQNKIDNAVEKISAFDKENEFQAIAFTGISGAAFAFPLAYLLNKTLICIRKANSSIHTKLNVEGHIDCTSYIIVDDFISTGSTITLIKTSIEQEYEAKADYQHRDYIPPKLSAIFLYDQSIFCRQTFFNNKYTIVHL